jgi:hypothetical protein
MSRDEGGRKCLMYIREICQIMIFVFTSCLLLLVFCPSYAPSDGVPAKLMIPMTICQY